MTIQIKISALNGLFNDFANKERSFWLNLEYKETDIRNYIQ